MSGERGVSRRVLVVVACFLGALLAPAVAKAAPTIVSLTFDDGTADQYAARTMLAQHSLHGTFYINSNNIGLSPSFLSWNQVADLAADGNEIGGHTLDHVDLTSVTSTEATRQVCNDRQALSRTASLPPTSPTPTAPATRAWSRSSEGAGTRLPGGRGVSAISG